MKRIIEGVTYNTDTSTLVARGIYWDRPPGADWQADDVEQQGDLYLTRGGAFFVVTRETENPEARPSFEPKTREQAERWIMKDEGEVELFDESVFAEPPEAAAEEGEPEATIYIRLPRPLKDRIEAAAKGESVSLNTYVMRCVEQCVTGETDEAATLREAFAYFDGAEARNPRWSWSARSANAVVLAIWDHDMSREGDTVRVDVRMSGGVPSLGNKERIKNLLWARDHCDGLFRVVEVMPKDRDARPRSIAKCTPQPTLVMKLTEIDEATGAFRAESVAA